MPSIAESSTAQRLEMLADKSAFFWMMLAVTAKYMVRQDAVTVQGFLDLLHHVLHDIEYFLDGQGAVYQRGSLMKLQATHDAQAATCSRLIRRMLDLRPRLLESGVDLPLPPTEVIERLLSLH